MSGALVAQAINESIGTAGFQGLDAILKEYLGLIAEQAGTARVPISRTINGHSLASDVDLDNNDVGAAPAGFGLGIQSTSTVHIDTVEKLDNLRQNRWFAFTGGNTGSTFSVSGITFSYGGGRVDTYNGDNLKMWFVSYNPSNHTQKYELVRYCHQGVWGEWEWVNPPMQVGVEYRTTERWNGKAVYALAVDLGSMPNNDIKDVYFQKSINSTNVISYEACMTSSDYGARTLPDYNEAGELRCYAVLLNACVRIKSFHNLSSYTGKMTIKFTQE